MISLIASVGRNLEIGKNGGLAFTGRGELGYFKQTTMGHAVLMGSRTYDSLPRRLEGREYNVAAFDGEFPDWVNVVRDLEQFLKAQQATSEEIFVIGGGSIYTAALPYAQKLYLTEIGGECEGADTFFPRFSPEEYERELVGSGAFDDGMTFKRYVYTRKAKVMS